MADNHHYSVEAARQAAQRDELGTWVAEFLSSPGSDNAELAAQLSEPARYWVGPVQLPLSLLHRLAGPEGAPVVIAVDDDDWEDNVDDMKDGIEEGWNPPPLIVSYRNGQLVLEDGNHRVESLRRAGEQVGWSVVGFDDPEQRDRFNPPTIANAPDRARSTSDGCSRLDRLGVSAGAQQGVRSELSPNPRSSSGCAPEGVLGPRAQRGQGRCGVARSRQRDRAEAGGSRPAAPTSAGS